MGLLFPVTHYLTSYIFKQYNTVTVPNSEKQYGIISLSWLIQSDTGLLSLEDVKQREVFRGWKYKNYFHLVDVKDRNINLKFTLLSWVRIYFLILRINPEF